MNGNWIERAARQLRPWVRRIAFAILLGSMALCSTDVAWAKKKKEEKVEVETKSYVFPYIIVMAMVSVGIMTVCRPSRRLDKVEERVKQDEE